MSKIDLNVPRQIFVLAMPLVLTLQIYSIETLV